MKDTDLVFQSYGRCCNSDQFFVDFYDHFMSSSDAIKKRFVNTDMPAQRHLLRNGVMQLILTARGMPDRKLDEAGDLMSHWFGQGDYVCETGWPNMRLTITDDGWMGIAPSGKEVLLRSLDFWRVEDGLIRENWVLVDLLDLYRQVGVDVLARMGEFNKARNIGPITVPSGMNP